MEIRTIKSSSRGPYRSYDSQSLSDAYLAVIDDGLPVQQAAKRYMVPITTLKDRVRGRVDIDVLKSGPAPMFTQEQEAILAAHLNTMGEVGYGYSRQETLNLASDYAVHLGLRDKQHPLSLQWLYSFLSRWPDLKVKKPRSLDIARAKSATESAVTNYFTELDTILTKYNLRNKPHMVYNVDEKGLSTEHKPPKIIAGKHYKAQAVTSGKGKNVTVIGAANAVGQSVPPFFVFPGARMLDSLLKDGSPGVAGDVSESGWSNSLIFEKFMKEHLLKYLPARGSDSYVLVLYDGHRSHVTIPLIEWAIQNFIILFVLPPHCSHLLQPLDVSCFGPFEIAWNSACHSFLRESGGLAVTRYDVCSIACKVYSSTLSPANVQAAFRKAGIFPFNPSVIRPESLAPSTAFSKPAEANQSSDGAKEDLCQQAVTYLENRGGQILKNVKSAKVRKTLSKVVGGKAITEPSILEAIRQHVETQNTKKPVETPRHQAVAGPSGVKTSKATKRKLPTVIHEDSQNSESDSSDMEDTDKCIVCREFYPKDKSRMQFLTIVKWGQCDQCQGWVHLSFCTTVRVLRRGDSFLCPNCQLMCIELPIIDRKKIILLKNNFI